MTEAIRDQNHVTVALGVSNTDATVTLPFKIDSATGRLLTDAASGSGTVTSVSVVTANGFAGTVATATTTPAITLTTTVTGILKGNGTAISAGVAGDVDSILPTQTGHSGEFLTTNGTTASWATPGGSGGITIGTTTITSGTNTRILYNNAGVVGEYTLTGTGTVVAMQTSPSFLVDITTPIAKLSATSNQLVFQSAGVTGTFTWTPTSTNKTVTVPDRTFTLDNITTATTTNGTGFLKGNGSVISFDNTTYLSTITIGSTTITSGTTTRILYNNAGVVGEYTLTGSGTVVVMATAPTFVTSITTPAVLATANDSGAIGAAGTAFSDLFLAEGGVINWDSGDVTMTQTGNVLAIAGGDLRVATADVGTNADSVPTLSSTSTLTNKTLTSPTINTATLGGAQQLAEGASIRLDAAGSADGAFSGVTIAGTAGATLAFGDLIYLAVADSRWELADADAATTSDRMLGICVLAAASDGDPTVILLMGTIRADAAFPALTIGAAAYVGETAGDIQVAIPTGADNVIRRVGYALTADELYFNPSMDSQITVA
mgnify:CR=1 FL=1